MIRFREVFPAKKVLGLGGLGRTIDSMHAACIHACYVVCIMVAAACLHARCRDWFALLGTHYLSLLWTRYTKEQSDAITALVV